MIGKKNPNLYYSLSFIFYFGLILSDTLFGPTDVEFLSNFHDCPSPTEFSELSVTNGGLTFGERFQIHCNKEKSLQVFPLKEEVFTQS